MDPTQCLKELLDLLSFAENEDRDDIIDHLQNLTTWIANSGFYPTVTKYQYENTYKIGE